MSTFIKKKGKGFLSILLTLMMLMSVVPASMITEAAQTDVNVSQKEENNSGYDVKIESFMRGDVNGKNGYKPDTGISDLRSSELLVARVTAKDNSEVDESELVYKWTNGLKTYLYVYSSHNMYLAQYKKAEGNKTEQEIYNSDNNVKATSNMGTNVNDKEYKGQGFQFASVYGAYSFNDLDAATALSGYIKVEVYDPTGETLLASDEISGKKTETTTRKWNQKTWRFETVTTVTYGQAFTAFNLKEDIDDAVFGVFVGETKDAKDLLGESAIVHINCSASSVTAAKVVSGPQYINVGGSGTAYTVTGKVETPEHNPAKIQLTVKKDNCKFHINSSATAEPWVYVFIKPKTETSSRTLTLYDDVRESYNYYIVDNMTGLKTKGEKVNVGTPESPKYNVVFSGLEPETKYTVQVETTFYDPDDTEKENPLHAYANVYDTTKPESIATVNVKLDNVLTDKENVGIDDLHLELANADTGVRYQLTKSSTGVYKASISDGTYYIYSGDKRYDNIGLVVNNSDVEATLNFYSVKYEPGATGVTNMPSEQDYYVNSIVEASEKVPERTGYIFKGWESSFDGNIVQPDGRVTISITKPITLTAQWEKAVNVDVNIVINHGADNTSGSAQTVDFELAGLHDGNNYSRTLTTSEHDGYNLTVDTEENQSKYTATAHTYANLPDSTEYSISTFKPNYVLDKVDKVVNGDTITYTVYYSFNPEYTEMKFYVELSQKLKDLKAAGKTDVVPKAANVKVTVYRLPFPGDMTGTETDNYPYWRTIIQQSDNSYVSVPIGNDGSGIGKIAVWGFEGDFPVGADTPVSETDSDAGYQFHFRTKVVSIVYSDGTVVPVNDTDDFDRGVDDQEKYVDQNGVYTVDVNVKNGKRPDGRLYGAEGTYKDSRTTLDGVYFKKVNENGEIVTKQISDVTNVIDANLYNVVFDKNYDNLKYPTAENVYKIPLFRYYIPTREGGYTFRGWFKDKECTIPAIAGAIINSTDGYVYDDDTKTITLFAKWDAPLTLSGDVKIHYTYNDQSMLEVDRPKSTKLIVERRQKATAEHPATDWSACTSTVINFNINNDVDTKHYEITDLPLTDGDGNEYEYRVVVNQRNFSTVYAPSQIAVINDSKGTVNAELTFVPDVFTLPYEVKTDELPDYIKNSLVKVNVKYEFRDEFAGDTAWQTIVQHTDTEISNAVENDKSTGEWTDLWKYSNVSTGNYQFRLKVVSYTIRDKNGDEQVVNVNNKDSLVDVIVDNAVRYTDYNEATKEPPIKAHLVAADHKITFYNNFVEDDNNDMFRTYHTVDIAYINQFTTLGDYHYNVDNMVDGVVTTNGEVENYEVNSFYEMPTDRTAFADLNNKYIFKGWYLDQDNNDDSRPVSLDWLTNSAKFITDTDVFAHWIIVDSVAKADDDEKITGSDMYNGFDLIGVQIRTADDDDQIHHGVIDKGLRFLTSMSKHVYDGLNDMDSSFEYGYALAKASSVTDMNDLLYTGVQNGTTVTSKAVAVECSGVPDHYMASDSSYRLYSAVVTYNGVDDSAKSQDIVARSYVRYKDANGLTDRVHYNDYTGTPVHKGCCTNYTSIEDKLKNR